MVVCIKLKSLSPISKKVVLPYEKGRHDKICYSLDNCPP
jgi:hypothetical protein